MSPDTSHEPNAPYDPPAGPIAKAVARGITRLALAVQPNPSDFGWSLAHPGTPVSGDSTAYKLLRRGSPATSSESEYVACCHSYAPQSFCSETSTTPSERDEHEGQLPADSSTPYPDPEDDNDASAHYLANQRQQKQAAPADRTPIRSATYPCAPSASTPDGKVPRPKAEVQLTRPSPPQRSQSTPRKPKRMLTRLASWSKTRPSKAPQRANTAPMDPIQASVAFGMDRSERFSMQTVDLTPPSTAASTGPILPVNQSSTLPCLPLYKCMANNRPNDSGIKPAKLIVKHKSHVRAAYNYFQAQSLAVGANPFPPTTPPELPHVSQSVSTPSSPVLNVRQSQSTDRVHPRRLSLSVLRKPFMHTPSLSPPLTPTRVTSTTSSTAQSVRKPQSNWAMRWSLDGRYVAVAGVEGVLYVYAVLGAAEPEVLAARVADPLLPSTTTLDVPDAPGAILHPTPVRALSGHGGAVLDVAWSKNGFLASCGSDHTVRLWHPKAQNCLGVFRHADIVASVVFHPRDERFILSGSLDGRLVLWNIPARKAHYSTKVPGILTAAALSPSGQAVLAGTFDGSLHVYKTAKLQLVASNRLTRSKITGIEPAPRSEDKDDLVLITSNDSRIRLWDPWARKLVMPALRSSLYLNNQTQIRATCAPDANVAVSGSEDGRVFFFDLPSGAPSRTGTGLSEEDPEPRKRCRAKPEQAPYAVWTGAHKTAVTVAAMAPLATHNWLRQAYDPILCAAASPEAENDPNTILGGQTGSRIVVTADAKGTLCVWRGDARGTLLPLVPGTATPVHDGGVAPLPSGLPSVSQEMAMSGIGRLPYSAPVLVGAVASPCAGSPTSTVLPLRVPWLANERDLPLVD